MVGLAGYCGVDCVLCLFLIDHPQEAGQHHVEKSKFSEVGQMAPDLHHLLGVLHAPIE